MGRSIFRDAFMGATSARRPVARHTFSVKPPTIAVNSYEIPPGALGKWLKHTVPEGYSGSFPRVVKTLDGEFLIYADDTAQFIPLGLLPGERFSIWQR